jgi:two-component system OmpR family response regulator
VLHGEAETAHRMPPGHVRHAMRLLIVEDDPQLRIALAALLRQSGYETDAHADGESAFAAVLANEYDLAIVDLMLPGMSGLMLLRNLRQRRYRLPILIVTGRGALDDRITGLDAGADDYLSKPFEMAELEARVRALLRRQNARLGRQIRVGPLTIIPGQPQVMLGGIAVTLPAGESVVLEALVARVGRVVSKASLADQSRHHGEAPSASAIEIRVHRLRRRLEPFGIRVRTLRGFGYLLEADADG